MDYGKFYQSEDQATSNYAHAECERKFENLAKQLLECKAQLELLRVRNLPETVADEGPHSTCSSPGLLCEDQLNDSGAAGNVDTRSSYAPSPRISDDQSQRPSRQETGLKSDAVAKRPRKIAGIRRESSDADSQAKNKRLASRDKGQTQRYQQTRNRDIPLKRPQTAAMPHRQRLMQNGRVSRSRPEGIHSATNKYDYYKYFGHSGQGAKSSWAHNLPLGYEPPYSLKSMEHRPLTTARDFRH